MHPQTKIGGVNRDGLLRVWFLFYFWVFCAGALAAQQNWHWFAFLFGSALTIFLIYRRSRLGGIVGFLVIGPAVILTLPRALSFWSDLLGGRGIVGPFMLYNVTVHPLILGFYLSALAFVPAAVFAVHFSSRHRILRAFEGREHYRGRVVTPSSYYLITIR